MNKLTYYCNGIALLSDVNVRRASRAPCTQRLAAALAALHSLPRYTETRAVKAVALWPLNLVDNIPADMTRGRWADRNSEYSCRQLNYRDDKHINNHQFVLV